MSSITVQGIVQKSNLGSGTWALVTDQGETYEIHHDAPEDLLKEGQKVKAKGQIRDDVMTIAMIGPVLEVKSFEVQ
jgi:cytochrome c-type biogenesis protein CcmE